MKHGTNVGVRQEIHDLVSARFEIHFDLGKTSDEGVRAAVVRVFVARRRYQTLAGQRRDRSFRKPVDIRVRLVAIVDAAELNGLLSGLRQCQAGASAFAEYALI